MKETELKIKTFGCPVLRKAAKPVVKVTDDYRKTLSAMARLMYEVQGVGLAAPQVGINEAMIVVDVGNGLYKLINPKIVKMEGTQQGLEEGCLSVPGVGIKVKRAKYVMLEALDQDGKPVTIEAEDFLARAFQHELDHLNGTLIVDHASVLEKIKMKKRLKELKELEIDG